MAKMSSASYSNNGTVIAHTFQRYQVTLGNVRGYMRARI